MSSSSSSSSSLVPFSLTVLGIVAGYMLTVTEDRRKKIVVWVGLLIITSLVLGTMSRNKEEELYRSPKSICKRSDSPFPLNQWDLGFLKHRHHLPTIVPLSPGSIWFPHNMSLGDLEYQQIPPSLRKHIWTSILPGSDNFVCKARLAVFGRSMSSATRRALPVSYQVSELPSGAAADSKNRKGKAYIAKSNDQRQQGVFICKDRLPLPTEVAATTAIIQELISDPLLIDGYKVTHRVYVLAICDNGSPSGLPSLWIYQDGFLYYATSPYDAESDSPNVHIASGYTDRSIYEKHPLTMKEHYQQRKICSPSLQQNIQKSIHQSIQAVLKSFLNPKAGFIERDIIGSFQLFGVDVQVIANGDRAYVLEVNKAPNLQVMDQRDGQLKEKMSVSMWNLLEAKLFHFQSSEQQEEQDFSTWVQV